MTNPLPSKKQMAANNTAAKLLNRGQPAEALSVLDNLLQENPEYWAAHFNQGNALKSLRRWKEAIEAYDQALALANKPPWLGILPMHIISQIHNNRGGALFDWGMLDSAKQAFEDALEADPMNLVARTNLQNMRQQFDKWLEVGHDAEGIDKNMNFQQMVEEHNQLGLTYFALGRYQEAVNEYKRAIEIDHDYLDARYNLAVVYVRGCLWQSTEEKIGEATTELKTIVTRNPMFHITCLLLADLYSRQQRLADAEKWYREALRVERVDPWEIYTVYNFNETPYHALVHQKLGEVLEQQERVPEALEHYQRAIELDRTYIRPRYKLGTNYLRLKQIEKAIEQFNAILKIDPTFRDTHFYLSQAYIAKGELQIATYHLQKELEHNSKNAYAHFSLAGIYANTGDRNKAIQSYRQVIELAPQKFPDAYTLLRSLLHTTKQYGKRN